ncbi:hypothetical protein RB597_005062 [Gaeumannomyces tritici]
MTSRTKILQATAWLSLSAPAIAAPQWWNNPNNGGNGGFGNGGLGGGNGNGNGNGNGAGFGNPNAGFGTDGNGFPNGFDNGNFLGFDLSRTMYYRSVHGILAALAFVLLFPLGSILMRIVPGRLALFVHAGTQVIALIIYVAAAALGIHLVQTVRLPFGNGTLLNEPSVNFHPIIGLVVLVMVVAQPVLGYLHHAAYKRLGRRQAWSHLHLWNGRVAITLGIVNGGLGLMISRAPARLTTAYTVVSAVMWVLWFCAAVLGECRRAMAARKERSQRRKEARRRERAHKTSVRSASS